MAVLSMPMTCLSEIHSSIVCGVAVQYPWAMVCKGQAQSLSSSNRQAQVQSRIPAVKGNDKFNGVLYCSELFSVLVVSNRHDPSGV